MVEHKNIQNPEDFMKRIISAFDTCSRRKSASYKSVYPAECSDDGTKVGTEQFQS